MWARMPITALVADEPLEDWPVPMAVHNAQPWDCPSHTHAVYTYGQSYALPLDGKDRRQTLSSKVYVYG